jgi:hypothetical protein
VARRPSKGKYTPSNPDKYLGDPAKIIYRSSWELSAMLFFDAHHSVVGWMSEGLPTNHVHTGLNGIPYRNPFTGRWTFYVPDFFIISINNQKQKTMQVIEVKPFDEVPPAMTGFTGKVNEMKQARQMLNAAKYAAAMQYCAARGWQFRVMTEKDMFGLKK